MRKGWIVGIFLAILFIGFIGSGLIYDNLTNQNSLNMDNIWWWEFDGNLVSQERTVEGFDSISLDGVGDVNVYPGEEYKVIVKTSSSLQEKVITTVNGSTLHIDQNQGNYNDLNNITIDIYLPELKNISLSGVGNFKINNGNASEFGVSLSGTGTIDAEDYQVENANVTLSGVGDISIWVTNTLEGKLSGMGAIDSQKYPMKNGNIILSGVGDISIWVTENLKGDFSGLGSVSYKGNPMKDINSNGIVAIEPMN
ncbi:MAG: DUF2807 domain-containing protein [Methanobrevibacter sp.]|nr:DUF2807 domain-containing protein [Methanobrevibacter sp.]